jgi:2-polyprenyl-3-methyl-5-hydroxy-6-metoxy-1,4-benzoquinol methylase
MPNTMRSLARWLANSPVMRRGRRLMEENERNWTLALSKTDKLSAGLYLIAAHYSTGRFPPQFGDREAAHEAERQYLCNLPGMDPKASEEGNTRKPFWNARKFAKYSQDFRRLLAAFEGLRLRPGSRLLELGCGGGWMASFLAMTGYDVLATTIGGPDVQIAARRANAFAALGLGNSLRYAEATMEQVDQLDGCVAAFDAVYVYEALHHAFSWQEALRAAFRCLRPGGWLVIASEPNVLHTFIAYRVAYLAGTHEVGFRKAALLRELRAAGFAEIRILSPRLNNWVTPFWIVARRPCGA